MKINKMNWILTSQSSNVAGFCYDDENQVLTVGFKKMVVDTIITTYRKLCMKVCNELLQKEHF